MIATKLKLVEKYDLWTNFSSLKVDITFGQLFEILPMACKTPKKKISMTRRTKKAN